MLGLVFQWLHLPGFILPFRYTDEDAGHVIEVKTSSRYTVLSIDGLQLFFIRESGKFDGAGAMSLDATAIGRFTAQRMRRSKDTQ